MILPTCRYYNNAINKEADRWLPSHDQHWNLTDTPRAFADLVQAHAALINYFNIPGKLIRLDQTNPQFLGFRINHSDIPGNGKDVPRVYHFGFIVVEQDSPEMRSAPMIAPADVIAPIDI
jgi:hypothetical protein